MRGWVRCGMTAVLLTAAALPARAAELRKVHILMVFDTDSTALGKTVALDKRRLERLWQETIPQGRYSLKVLEGKRASRRDVLDHYRALKVAHGEGLLFYYAGHGATDKRTGKHYFELTSGPLFRHEVLASMEAKKADLTVVVTDCCSTSQAMRKSFAAPRGAVPEAIPRAAPPRRLHPTVRSLLFQPWGTVDITAATDNASWSDDEKGGLFTRSICRTLRQPVPSLDGDGSVSWRKFYPRLRDDTRGLFGTWRKEMLARGERVDERKQVPHAFRLGWARPARRPATLAVVGRGDAGAEDNGRTG